MDFGIVDGRQFDILRCLENGSTDYGLGGGESERWPVKLAEPAGAPGRTVMLMGEVGSGSYGQQYCEQREHKSQAARATDSVQTC